MIDNKLIVESPDGKVVLDIHLEHIAPERFPDGDQTYFFKEILDRDIPVVLSLAPWQHLVWTPKIIDLSRVVVGREGSFLGQQGELHMCSHNHRFVDPHHENKCLWRLRRISEVKQRALMERGMNWLAELMAVVPAVYSSPNHLFDSATLRAVQDLGYQFFSDNAVIPLKPYMHNGLKVIPEGSLEKGLIANRSVVYIHYDRIQAHRELYDTILNQGIVSLGDIQVSSESNGRIFLNEGLKRSRKYLRDLKNFVVGERHNSRELRDYRSSYRD